jgi:hypothetical protein
MFAQRLAIVLASSTVIAFLPVPAAAQIADDVVLNILRECARIDDPTSRLACFDNNIRNAGPNSRSTIPGQVRAEGGPGVTLNSNGQSLTPGGSGATGFGREDVRTPERFNAAPDGEAEAIAATVQSVTQRGYGIYVLTLSDGAQWIFTDAVNNTYTVPRRGSRIEIRRGAIDSFLMRFNNQASVRVRRVQ